MKNGIILQTKDLSIGYVSKKKQQIVASNINLSLEKGKLVSLIGANGIGKSTLLRTITGMQKAITGEVMLDGKNMSEYTALALAQQIGVVLTEKLPPSNLTVFEIVALGRQPYTNWIGNLSATDITKVNIALDLTQISHLSQKKHYEISDGQLQKALVARAFAQDTPLIILDEPTTHLDLLHKTSLFRLLKKLTSETGKCILFSTHDIDMAIQISDEMIVMSANSTIQDHPKRLAAGGIFDRLFDDDNVSFDTANSKFVFKNL